MPTPPAKYSMQFVLVDPARLRDTADVARSTTLTITALVKGRSSDMEGLDPKTYSQLLDHNLADMTHDPRQAAALIQAATDTTYGGGTTLFYFCALCGRGFSTHGCRRCNIGFELEPPGNHLSSIYTPILPARIVAYATAHGVQFVARPPRA